jgi:hypothetical protein
MLMLPTLLLPNQPPSKGMPRWSMRQVLPLR